MITRKSKIKYEIVVSEKEKNEIRNIYENNGYLYYGVCEMIAYRPTSIKWSMYFTEKQYKLFKRLLNETKNKK